jgi:microsomal dipeptidase-like Zn-dependent dipeptidase
MTTDLTTLAGAANRPIRIDALQFCSWSREDFLQMREGGLTAVHATIAYHEGLRETVRAIEDWNARFRAHADLIMPGRSSQDIDAARVSGRTAIFFGLQNPTPIEDDLGLVEILHALGVRFMQLTYNNQSLLGCGWMEREDSGITRMGREVVAEMNRVGMVVDLSHAGERTTLEAIELSARPIAITHANPSWRRDTRRNVSADVVKALGRSGGMLGLSLYPHHLPRGPETTRREFCEMAAEVAEMIGVEHVGIGSDLCRGQPNSVVRWMREGRWTRPSAEPISFPPQPDWFRDSGDFPGLAEELREVGFAEAEVAKVMGENWRNFFARSFAPAGSGGHVEGASIGATIT